MSSYQIFSKNIVIVGFTNILITLRGILLLPVITKLLGTENYGIWVQLGVTISLITPLAVLGLPFAQIRFLAAQKDRKEIQESIYSVLVLILLISLIIGFFFIILAGPIGSFLQSPPIFIKILALIILFECLNLVLLSVFQAFQEIIKYSFLSILQTFGEVGLVITAVFLNFGLKGAVLSLLVVRLIVFLILFSLILKRFGIKIPTFSPLKKYLHFGLPTVASSLSYWAVTSSNRYLVGFFLGVLFVGYYAPAHTLGNVLTFFIYPFSFMLPIVLSKLFDENKIEMVKNYLKYSLKYFLLIALPTVFGLSILSKQLLTIFATSEIASQGYFITPFIALSLLFYGFYTILVQPLILVKKTKIFSLIWIFAALINISLNFIFIPYWGILGAAITTLISYTFSFILTWYFAFKELPFEIDWKFIIKSVFASVLMTLFIVLLQPTGLAKTILAIISGALLYGILIFFFKGFDKKEIEFLKNLFNFI